MLKPQLLLPQTSTSVIVFRTPPDRIPYAARSDSVRRPIRFRPPSDQIPYATRLDFVRRPPHFLCFYINQPQHIHLYPKALTKHYHYIHTLILGI